jgi:Ca2+-binding RTX toxin-like protein
VGAQDILVNSTPRNSNYEPKIQGLANGGFVIAWEDETGDADNGSVQARVYGADGAPVGTAILVNTTTDGTQSDPRIAALADGGFVIAFTDGDAGADVRAQAFSEAGARVGTEILVNSTTAGDQGNAQVTALDEGGFVVTWRDAGDLRAQVFGIEGGAPQPSPEPPAPPPTEGTADEDEVTLSMKSDSYAAGSGNDWVWAGGGHDTVQGNTGNDVLHGYDGDDLMHGGKDDDEVLGEDGNDLLFGDLGNDLVHGGAGNDLCEGGEGNDIVRGGQGNDVVRGGAGDDWLSGDKGDDTVTGGTGADIFHSFSGAGLDRITDFSRAEGDRIQLDPGTTYTVAQTGADTVVTLGGGGQVVLVGVTASTLGEGWIFGA